MINNKKHFLKSFITLSLLMAYCTCSGLITPPNATKSFVEAIKPYIYGIFAINNLYSATYYSAIAFGVEKNAFPPSPIEHFSQNVADLVGHFFPIQDAP